MNCGKLTGRNLAGQPIEITWENGIIQQVRTAAVASENEYLLPGLLDLQVNGFAGVDFQRDSVSAEELLVAVHGLRKWGCTQFFLTLITDEWSKTLGRLRWYRTLRDKIPELNEAIAGWHIEGPFLSAEPGFCGAHNPALMADPSPAQMQELREVCSDQPLLVTLAPERKNALETIRRATELGITVSLGHTNASAEVLAQAVEAGARAFTHLGNGCPQTLDRHDNILWRVMERSDVMISLIPDGIHVSPMLFRLIHRTLPPGNIYYTTDAMAAAGSPPGRYRLAHLELEVGADEVVRLPGKPNLAGSALKPKDAVIRASWMLGEDWLKTWKRYSNHPRRLMRLGDSPLMEGSPATFCRVSVGREEDWGLEVWKNGAPI